MRAFLFVFLLYIPFRAAAQLAPACAGGSPAVDCASACINCNFNGYTGSTAGYPSGVVPNFCGTVENAQWMGFIAGNTHVVFTVTPSNCSDGNGIQVALYEDCMGQPLACYKGDYDSGNIPATIDVQVTPGRNYFLMIDGFAGDQCDFYVSVSPNDAVYEPPLGAVGSITGPAKVCPGATMTYSVAEVFGASAYIWSGPPGTMIDTLPLPVTLVGNGANQATITFGDTGGQICVQAANSCNQTPACTTPFNVEILDDSFRPVIQGDTVAHLTCSGAPAVLQADVQAGTGFDFLWTADSTGHFTGATNFAKTTVDKTGTYTLLVTNNQNGCTSSLAIQVGEPDTPRTAEIYLKQISCYGFDDGFLRIGAVSGGLEPLSYSIDGNEFDTSPEFRYLEPGTYPLTIKTADACRWDTVFTVVEPEELILNLGLDTLIQLGDSIRLYEDAAVNLPDRIEKITVVPDLLSPMMCPGCLYLPLNSFRYTVTVTDSSGCRDSDDRIVSVAKDHHVYVPNVFAPGASIAGNEVFTVYGGDDVERVEWLRVFNRWGQLVFENTAGFAPNDERAGWNGIVNGDQASPSVFVWQTSILYRDGEKETRTGNVTLVR